MVRKILSNEEFPRIKKLQKKFNISRAVDIHARKNLEIVELVSPYGVFRGFGKSTKQALKNATKVVKHYYLNTKGVSI